MRLKRDPILNLKKAAELVQLEQDPIKQRERLAYLLGFIDGIPDLHETQVDERVTIGEKK